MNRNSSEVIDIEEAKSYTHEYQKQFPEAIKSFFVGRDKLSLILEQKGCIGVSIYEGIDPKTQQKNLVLVGVDESGKSMELGPILQHLKTCPPMCAEESSLNL